MRSHGGRGSEPGGSGQVMEVGNQPEFSAEQKEQLGRAIYLLIDIGKQSPARMLVEARRIGDELEAVIGELGEV